MEKVQYAYVPSVPIASSPSGAWFTHLSTFWARDVALLDERKRVTHVRKDVLQWLHDQEFSYGVYDEVFLPGDTLPCGDLIGPNDGGSVLYYLGIHNPDEALFYQIRWRGTFPPVEIRPQKFV